MSSEARTLLDTFSPPDGLKGNTLALVTMTADTDVLEDIMVRFTGQSALVRARQGMRLGFLMRDPHSWDGRTDILRPGSVPGLHELRPRLAGGRRVRLLHAKLALLTFSPNGRGAPTHARLLVMTGNLTRASLRHRLELAFVVDADLAADPSAATVDIREAARFVRDLAERHFELTAERVSSDLSPTLPLDVALKALTDLRGPPAARFLHSLDESLFAQLKRKIEAEVKPSRNLLLCASGFVEQTVCEVEGPEVLDAFARLAPFAKHARRILMVFPGTTGQLRDWALRAREHGWDPPIHAHDVEGLDRMLHAKYVLIGRLSAGEHAVSGGHLYLGSGNLSRRGMLASGPREGGNIECGVFFEVGTALSGELLARRLFWTEDARDIEPHEWATPHRGPAQPLPDPIEPCPILHACLEAEGRLVLVWSSEAAAVVKVSADGVAWFEVAAGAQIVGETFDPPPAELQVRGKNGAEWVVPVVDEMGRYAWLREQLRSFDDLVAAIRDYPPSDVPSDEEEAAVEEPEAGPSGRSARIDVERRYPLLDMATLVESIARQQQSLTPLEIDGWLEHLERLRDRPMADALRTSWERDACDWLGHLHARALAPAEMSASQRRRYRAIIEALARPRSPT